MCSYSGEHEAALLMKGGVQIKRVHVGEADVDGCGWLWLGAVPQKNLWPFRVLA